MSEVIREIVDGIEPVRYHMLCRLRYCRLTMLAIAGDNVPVMWYCRLRSRRHRFVKAHSSDGSVPVKPPLLLPAEL